MMIASSKQQMSISSKRSRRRPEERNNNKEKQLLVQVKWLVRAKLEFQLLRLQRVNLVPKQRRRIPVKMKPPRERPKNPTLRGKK